MLSLDSVMEDASPGIYTASFEVSTGDGIRFFPVNRQFRCVGCVIVIQRFSTFLQQFCFNLVKTKQTHGVELEGGLFWMVTHHHHHHHLGHDSKSDMEPISELLSIYLCTTYSINLLVLFIYIKPIVIHMHVSHACCPLSYLSFICLGFRLRMHILWPYQTCDPR